MDILNKIFGDTPGKLEKWYNWTGVAIPVTTLLLLVVVIQNFFIIPSKTRRR